MSAYRTSLPVPASLSAAGLRPSTLERRVVHYIRHTRSCREAVWVIWVLAILGIFVSALVMMGVLQHTIWRVLGVAFGALATFAWYGLGALLLRYRWWARGTPFDVPVMMPEWKEKFRQDTFRQELQASSATEITEPADDDQANQKWMY